MKTSSQKKNYEVQMQYIS